MIVLLYADAGVGLQLTIPVNGTSIQNVISPRATIVVLDPATAAQKLSV